MDFKTLISALPDVNSWINDYIARHADSRVRISDAGFSRLPCYFSSELLENAYFVLVRQIETPPLAKFGLGELSFKSDNYGGITYKDTFFVKSKDESLCFHEMIHIVQWQELGPEKFLLAYGVGLMQFGYRESPLEQIAYSLQSEFDKEESIDNLESLVRNDSRELIRKMG